MNNYKYDTDGHLIRQWWECKRCGGHFYHWIEICRCCGQDAIPSKVKGCFPRIIQWNNGWALLTPHPEYQFGWLVREIKDEGW